MKNRITIEQFFILYLLARNDFNLPDKQSMGKAYIAQFGMFGDSVVQDLVRKGFLENFNSPGEYWPELFMLTPPAQAQFASAEMTEELWTRYPATFRLGDKGTKFIAKAGGDRDELLADYLRRINNSTPKHRFAMTQLDRYVKLVNNGEVNGHKIGDWIRQEMWDTVAEIGSQQEGGSFGKDF